MPKINRGREELIIIRINQGFNNKEIAKELGITEGTLLGLKTKLKVRDRIFWDKETVQYLIYRLDKINREGNLAVADKLLEISFTNIITNLQRGIKKGFISINQGKEGIKLARKAVNLNHIPVKR